MYKKQLPVICAFLILAFAGEARSLLAHGDRVIPQMIDGVGVGRTKFTITYLSQFERVTRLRLQFFRQDGTPWTVSTNMGDVSEIPLELGPSQSVRIETRGTSSPAASGYAVLRNTDITSSFVEDYEVSITVFYEILVGTSVVDTVSVPTGEPTIRWDFPVDMDLSTELLTGFAIVNRSDSPNRVVATFWEATGTSSGPATQAGSGEFTLNARQQRSEFLNQIFPDFFAGRNAFRGKLECVSERPVAVLALLQTRVSTGVQYATLVPAYKDLLRKNATVYLRQGFPLDADLGISDYFAEGREGEDFVWDMLYEGVSPTSRRLVPRGGAEVATLGILSDDAFDAVTLEQLQGLTYGTGAIDMSNGAPSLAFGFTFAIRTGLGRFAKVHVGDVISSDAGNRRELALEIFTYR